MLYLLFLDVLQYMCNVLIFCEELGDPSPFRAKQGIGGPRQGDLKGEERKRQGTSGRETRGEADNGGDDK